MEGALIRKAAHALKTWLASPAPKVASLARTIKPFKVEGTHSWSSSLSQ